MKKSYFETRQQGYVKEQGEQGRLLIAKRSMAPSPTVRWAYLKQNFTVDHGLQLFLCAKIDRGTRARFLKRPIMVAHGPHEVALEKMRTV